MVKKMNIKEYENKKQTLESEILKLPKGIIVKKKINNNIYYYNRYKENDKTKEKYIDFDLVSIFQKQIEKRKELEKELKQIDQIIKSQQKTKIDESIFLTSVFINDKIKKFVEPVKEFKKRECYYTIKDYLYKINQEKILILYGLRRTGKTTLIKQIILNMNSLDLSMTAYIKIKPNDTLYDLDKDLRILEKKGFKYLFIDEITLLEDFIEGAALLSDVYASCGMKIVLSGIDSLGFIFSKNNQLYDRCYLLHTTFIPYYEAKKVLGINDIDEYIEYGGTMTKSGTIYNDEIFFDNNNVNEYVDTAIAKNIQHSLKYYDEGKHFRHLIELYEKNELTSAINRIIEDINHRFTIDVLTNDFKSNDLRLSKRNLLTNKNESFNLDENLDSSAIEAEMKSLLDILNKYEQTINIEEAHIKEIKEYLLLLDLIYEIDKLSFPNINIPQKLIVISQPGIRYVQAKNLVKLILRDEKFNKLMLNVKNYIISRIDSQIKGRMLEEIILLETKIASPNKQVFKLQFDVEEFDMVIYDPKELECEIFEIKYSKVIVDNQYIHLIDEEKCKKTTDKFGNINKKTVLYRGQTTNVNGIIYKNISEYLEELNWRQVYNAYSFDEEKTIYDVSEELNLPESFVFEKTVLLLKQGLIACVNIDSGIYYKKRKIIL